MNKSYRDYRYEECGLDNVIIHGMEIVIDDAGDEVYRIRNILGLHKVIAHCLITRSHGMLPEELRFLRTEMGLTQSELAQVVKKDHQTIGRWERGEKQIDQNAELVIRMYAAEKLGIDPQISVEELARRCVPSAELHVIKIDGTDPEAYRPIAA
jgi:transcriptional regulator with XRE-family HTH domain